MSLQDLDPASLTIFDFFAYLVADDDAAAARERFCEVVASQIDNVASWLGVDAWLGAGDVQDTSSTDQEEPDPSRRRSFVAVGLVSQISSELVSGALLLFRNGNEYSASALVRQLIECEYLLRAFRLNFADAGKWHAPTTASDGTSSQASSARSADSIARSTPITARREATRTLTDRGRGAAHSGQRHGWMERNARDNHEERRFVC